MITGIGDVVLGISSTSGYGILNKRFKLQAASAFVKEIKVKRRRDDDGEDDIEKEKKVPRIKLS
jgi:hypothetical protein